MDFYATNKKPAAKSAKPPNLFKRRLALISFKGKLALIVLILMFGTGLYFVYLEYKDYLLLMENGEYASAVVYSAYRYSGLGGKHRRRMKWVVSYSFIVDSIEYQGEDRERGSKIRKGDTVIVMYDKSNPNFNELKTNIDRRGKWYRLFGLARRRP